MNGAIDQHLQAAARFLEAGDPGGAWRECEAALHADPACYPAHGMMARMTFPGPPYTEVLGAIDARLKPRTYLEIGVASGKTIVLAAAQTRAIGVVLALKKYRPDLRIDTIATAPAGLVVVRGLDPGSRLLSERMDEIVAEFLAVDYAVLDDAKPGMLNLYPNDETRIGALLA